MWSNNATQKQKRQLSYRLKQQDWIEPQTTGEDARKGDARLVAGGPPRPLYNTVYCTLMSYDTLQRNTCDTYQVL